MNAGNFKGTLKRMFTFQWLGYHIKTLFVLTALCFPFRRSYSAGILRLRPPAAFLTFVFSFLSCLFLVAMITTPVIQLIVTGQLRNTLPGLLFIIPFTIAFRFIQQAFGSFIRFDGYDLKMIQYLLVEKSEETIPALEFKGLFLLKHVYQGTLNRKICLVLKDERKVLLKLAYSDRRAAKSMERFQKIFNLNELFSENDSMPVNNINVTNRRD